MAEFADLSQQMYTALQRGQPAPQPAAPQPPPPAPNAPASAPSQEDFLTRPEWATRQLVEQLRRTEFDPTINQQTQLLGALVKENVKMQHPDDFRRWGPEIELTLQQYAPDPRAWTPDNLKAVVEVVRGRHAHEITEDEVEKRVRERMQQQLGGATLRPDGGLTPSAAATNQLDFTKLPQHYATTLQRMGVDQRTLDDFLLATKVRHEGISLEQAREKWLAEAQKGDIITDGVNQNEFHSVPLTPTGRPNPDAVGGVTMRQLGYKETV
jgi:hypothetical protein